MKKIIIASFFIISSIASFGQANTYFHDRIDTTIFSVADTVGHGANNYYATNTSADFNVKQYENGFMVNIFFKKGNTGSATLTLITKTGTLLKKNIRKSGGGILVSGDITDSTNLILTYYNGNFRIEGVMLPVGGMFWSLTGNAGTTAGTNFIGTTDNNDFAVKVNNIFSGLITYTSRNTFLGNDCGTLHKLNNLNNTCIGWHSFEVDTGGQDNACLGMQSMLASKSVVGSVAIGVSSLHDDVNGYSNVAVGFHAMYKNQGAYGNTAVGYVSLPANTSGIQNTAIGQNAFNSNADGYWNTSVGAGSGNANVSGHQLTFIGTNCGRNSTWNDNTAVGANSFYSIVSGSGNVCIGTNAGEYGNVWSNCTVLGAYALRGAGSTWLGNNSGTIALGYYAAFYGSNWNNYIFIGNRDFSDSASQVSKSAIFGYNGADSSTSFWRVNGKLIIRNAPTYTTEAAANAGESTKGTVVKISTTIGGTPIKYTYITEYWDAEIFNEEYFGIKPREY